MTKMTNTTTVAVNNFSSPWFIFAVVGQFISGFLGIIVNLLLLYGHMKDPCKVLKCSSPPFIINIAFIDLLSSLLLFVESAYLLFFTDIDFSYLYSNMFKIFNSILQYLYFTMFASFFSLAIVRFSSVAFPLWYRVKITSRVSRGWITAIWLFNGAASGITDFLYIFYDLKFGVSLAEITFLSLLLLLCQSFYTGAYVSLRRQRKDMSNTQDQSESWVRTMRIRLENEQNFLITIVVVCLASILSFLLHLLLAFLVTVSAWNLRQSWLILFLMWTTVVLGFTQTINGPVYVWRMKKYRITFKKLYCRCLEK